MGEVGSLPPLHSASMSIMGKLLYELRSLTCERAAGGHDRTILRNIQCPAKYSFGGLQIPCFHELRAEFGRAIPSADIRLEMPLHNRVVYKALKMFLKKVDMFDERMDSFFG